MARYLFRLPDVGEGVAEAEIAAWRVAPGDRVEEDQPLVDVMTEKATVEITSPVSGAVVALHGEAGDKAAVGSTLVELEIEGEDAAEPPAAPSPLKAEPAPETQAPPRTPPLAEPLAAPATRRRATELGVPLELVLGTGPGGRITPQDVEAYAAAQANAAATAGPAKRTGVHETKIIGLRRKIAEKMQDSARRIPHFSYVEEFDLTELEALRRTLNEDAGENQPKLTLLPFFMVALAKLQPEFPYVNAHYDDEAGVLRAYDGVHVGIATQTEGGLMVPVVRHVETLNLWACARELARVTTAARDGRAGREELSGSTITLTSLGALGGLAATPIINAPEVAIIGPNKLEDRPVVRDGQITIRKLMNVSASFDHRIVDGHDAARFVQRLKRLIEQPALLFLDQA